MGGWETSLSRDVFSKILKWLNPPDDDGIELSPGIGLKITPNPKTDYWLKDFRVPPAHRVSGHALLYTVPAQLNEWVFNTTFTLEGKVLYDQAGIMVLYEMVQLPFLHYRHLKVYALPTFEDLTALFCTLCV